MVWQVGSTGQLWLKYQVFKDNVIHASSKLMPDYGWLRLLRVIMKKRVPCQVWTPALKIGSHLLDHFHHLSCVIRFFFGFLFNENPSSSSSGRKSKLFCFDFTGCASKNGKMGIDMFHISFITIGISLRNPIKSEHYHCYTYGTLIVLVWYCKPSSQGNHFKIPWFFI